MPFFWVSLRLVDATPLASVTALADWVPSWKATVLPASGLPVASTNLAESTTTLFGAPVVAPVAASAPAAPTYHVYAGAESADKIYRIRFDGRSASVEREIPIGELPAE